MFSALAARAGGAEAEADWFPRWASFASEHTPYIHSRGYQTLRTSGSTGAAAAAVLEIQSMVVWLARGKTTSPTSGAPLAHTMLTPNHLVKSMIAEYQESRG